MERLPPFLKFGLSKSLVTLAACIRHYSPRLGRLDWTAVGSALRESHPSEDLSELPPLFETVAGQWVQGWRGHCKTACHGCFWLGGDRWAPSSMAVFDSRNGIHCNPSSATGGLGAPAASLVPFVMGPSADVISRRIWPLGAVFFKVLEEAVTVSSPV